MLVSHHESLVDPDVWEEAILACMDRFKPQMEEFRYPTLELIMRSVDLQAMPGYFLADVASVTPAHRQRFASILSAAGYARRRIRSNGRRAVVWMPAQAYRLIHGHVARVAQEASVAARKQHVD